MTLGACQDDGGDGNGGGGTTPTGTQTGTTTGTTTGTATGVGGGTSTGTNVGGNTGCGYNATDATVQEVTNGTVGTGVEVRLTGVIAMTRKFLVSKSSSGSCLWGVFISAPGLTTTEEYSGVIAVSYGFPAEVPEGGTQDYCPVIELNEPAGDAFPDDVAPGDVLDIVGETDSFLLTQYCTDAGDSQVPAKQVSQVCSVNRTSSGATLPTPATIATADLSKLGSPTDTDFHDKWGGVKVRIENVTADEAHADFQPGDCTGGEQTIVGMKDGTYDVYGTIELNEGDGLRVGNEIYYQGLMRSLGASCRGGPEFCTTTGTPYSFTYIEGFNYLDFCTWTLQPAHRCNDFSPAGDGCPCSENPD
jgi:hypothetical protein